MIRIKMSTEKKMTRNKHRLGTSPPDLLESKYNEYNSGIPAFIPAPAEAPQQLLKMKPIVSEGVPPELTAQKDDGDQDACDNSVPEDLPEKSRKIQYSITDLSLIHI